MLQKKNEGDQCTHYYVLMIKSIDKLFETEVFST